jgi:hypothetical protein
MEESWDLAAARSLPLAMLTPETVAILHWALVLLQGTVEMLNLLSEPPEEMVVSSTWHLEAPLAGMEVAWIFTAEAHPP